MEFNSDSLIEELISLSKELHNETIRFKSLPLETLNWRESDKRWSILECIEHLNRYGDFYNPEIEKRIKSNKNSRTQTTFKNGLLGGYFANSMKPREKLNSMNTLKDKNPLGSQLGYNTLDKFIGQQEKFIVLLNEAKLVDLTKTKTSISIPFPTKLRLGDTLRFVSFHNQRHLEQAKRVLNSFNIQNRDEG